MFGARPPVAFLGLKIDGNWNGRNGCCHAMFGCHCQLSHRKVCSASKLKARSALLSPMRASELHTLELDLHKVIEKEVGVI
ncbi:MAG: hypothetical protein CL912_33700 [Deltaproteobacteria bacterium]|nr:hypothetical protein [Deltaproteobacteria bacterium]|tara:strand:+ start:1647 stop:1889 length:243 start_codon:yes stop_codon:yes gene_type:complete